MGTCVSIIRSAIFSSIGLEANAFTLATSASSRGTMVVIKQRMRVNRRQILRGLRRFVEHLGGHTNVRDERLKIHEIHSTNAATNRP